MSHLALYRKYRSQNFGDLIGQAHIVRTLQNSITSERIAHAFLFTGPRGTGKTSTARLLAKALNCEKGPAAEPCNECPSCVEITAGNSIDVLELDAASQSSVDDVREKIVAASDYRPSSSRFRVFIIDEVHDLSSKAFDALLKTIEEPPAHCIFILATTEFDKVPPTIRSRCQKYEFHRGSIADLVGRLGQVASLEGVEIDSAALAAIARIADGGYRDALTLLEQAIVTSSGPITLEHVYNQLGLIRDDRLDAMLDAIKAADVRVLLDELDAVYQTGRDSGAIVEGLASRVALLTRSLYGVDDTASQDAPVLAHLHEVATRLGQDMLSRVREHSSRWLHEIRHVTLPRLWLEAEMISLAIPSTPVVAQEKPRPPAAARPAVSNAEKAPETVAAERVSEPAPTPPKVEFSTKSTPSEAAWRLAVSKIAETSKTGGARLQQTRVTAETDTNVTVTFDRQTDLDWVLEKPKFFPMLETSWLEQPAAKGRKLVLISNSLGVQPMEAAVELPASGEKLKAVGSEVLGDL